MSAEWACCHCTVRMCIMREINNKKSGIQAEGYSVNNLACAGDTVLTASSDKEPTEIIRHSSKRKYKERMVYNDNNDK